MTSEGVERGIRPARNVLGRNRTRHVFAVDLGASGGKCFVASVGKGVFALKEVHRFKHEPAVLFLPDRTGAIESRTCWDDLFIYNQIIEGLRAYRREVSDTVDAIGIDSWGTDGAFMTPDSVSLGPMYSYRDHRLDLMVDKLKRKIDPGRIYSITGVGFNPFNVSNQLLWYLKNRGDLARECSRFLPTPTVFGYYIGGVTSVDSTWASVTQLMDAREGRWSAEVLRCLEIPRRMLPKIVRPGSISGRLRPELADSLGLNNAPVVAVASHDTASAYAAAPITSADDALIISSGTWSLVGKLIPKPITTLEAMAAGVSNEGGIGDIRFLKNCMGLWVEQELRRVWRMRDGRELSWDELETMSQRAEPFSAFLDLDDSGFYNPKDMESAVAAYCRRTGQAPPSTRGATLRTVYESLALKYRVVADQIASITGLRSSVIHVVGGGARNALLNQLIANACGAKVIAGPEEATAVGNAIMQAVALGIIRELSSARRLVLSAFPVHLFNPKDRAGWDAAYQRYLAITRQKVSARAQ